MSKTSTRWTRRQFLVAASASAAALLDACARPTPTLDSTRQPALGAKPQHSVYLPNVRQDAAPTPTPVPSPTPTSPPKPTPTPRRTFPTFDRPSKLGIAVQRFRDRRIMDRIVTDGHPRVVKIWDDLGAAVEVKQHSPNTIVVGHIKQPYDFQHALSSGATDMAAAAADFVAQHLSRYQANPGIDYWEGHNEPVFERESHMALYGQFEAERVRQMAAHGLKTAVGNFSSGNPPIAQWDDFFPALQAAKQHEGSPAHPWEGKQSPRRGQLPLFKTGSKLQWINI